MQPIGQSIGCIPAIGGLDRTGVNRLTQGITREPETCGKPCENQQNDKQPTYRSPPQCYDTYIARTLIGALWLFMTTLNVEMRSVETRSTL